MMEEKEILKTLREFRKIKPEKEWVLATKKEILGQTPSFLPFFNLQTAFLTLLVLIGLFKASEGALPGEPLYLIKKSTEEIQSVILPETEKPKMVLERVEKRAKELEKVATLNETKKLAPAIKEFKEGASKAAKILSQSSKIDKTEIEKIYATLQTARKVEENLGTEVTPSQFENAIKEKLKLIIQDLEQKSLTENQSKILNSAKEDLEKDKIEEAFAKVMLILQND